MRKYKYYKVKLEHDNKRRPDGSILVGNELYTEKEMLRYKIPFSWVDPVSVTSSEKYFFFGARLSIYYPRPTN